MKEQQFSYLFLYATISDRKLVIPNGYNFGNGGNINTYTADVLSTTDYYPFGMQMPERNFSSSEYRYGFNGQERDNEVSGNGNSYTAQFWQYDSRLGRRWNQDPKPNPSISNYAAFANNPIWYTDHLGDTINLPSVNITAKRTSEKRSPNKKSFTNRTLEKVKRVATSIGNSLQGTASYIQKGGLELFSNFLKGSSNENAIGERGNKDIKRTNIDAFLMQRAPGRFQFSFLNFASGIDKSVKAYDNLDNGNLLRITNDEETNNRVKPNTDTVRNKFNYVSFGNGNYIKRKKGESGFTDISEEEFNNRNIDNE